MSKVTARTHFLRINLRDSDSFRLAGLRFVPDMNLRQSLIIRENDRLEEHAARTTYSRRCRSCGTIRVPDAFWQHWVVAKGRRVSPFWRLIRHQFFGSGFL